MREPRRLALAALTLALAWAPAGAAPPPPIHAELHPFPGSFLGPTSARSTGLAFADRWLGDEPFDNPSWSAPRGAMVAGVLQRMNRQDLKVDRRSFDEQTAFIDAAGGWLAYPVGAVTLGLYASQPVLRLEQNAYSQGDFDPGTPVIPAVIEGSWTARELRAGLAASAGTGIVRFGVAGEWVNRDDRYETVERSGSPEQGERMATFSGSGVGAQTGVRLTLDGLGIGPLAVGAGARLVPALQLDGTQRQALLVGTTEGPVSVERESGVEGGLSARWNPIPAWSIHAGGGVRTEQEWRGFGVSAGRASVWSVGTAFHDERDTWGVRIGFGAEEQKDAQEPKASLLGLGFEWHFDRSALEIGILHRGIERSGRPKLYDDRVVVSFRGTF